MAMFGSMAKVFSTPKFKKRKFDPEKMSIEDIDLPRRYNLIDKEALRPLIKGEIDIFKALDYKHKPDDQLKCLEYNSWQIGILLKFIKEDMVYLYNDIENILSSNAVYITKKNLHIKVFNIVYRYNQEIDKDDPKEILEKDIRWSPQDAAYLLRYITTENRNISRKKG